MPRSEIRIGRRCVAPIAAVLLLSTSGCYAIAFGGPAAAAVVGGAAAGAGAGAVVGAHAGPDTNLAAPGVPVGSAIKLTLGKARDLAAVHSRSADTTWLRGTRAVFGRIQPSSGDTLRIVVSGVWLERGLSEYFPRDLLVLAVPRDSTMSIEVLNIRPSITQGIWTGVGVGLLVGVIVASFVLLTDFPYGGT